MNNKIRTVLQPEYMKEFSCIGQNCEDSCCIGWTVALDKKTYLNYKKIKHDLLTPKFQKVLKKNSEKSDVSYGIIKMDKENKCPLLDEKGLCEIHSHLGEGCLSETCSVYPRFLSHINSQFERSATMSCPEITRLALLNPEGIEFEYIEENIDSSIKNYSTFNPDHNININKAQRYFWDIRIFSISILQNRFYDLEERLILLGMVYKKIEDLISENKVMDIPLLLEDMNKEIDLGTIKNELESIPTNTLLQMRIALSITNIVKSENIINERYLDCLSETLEGIEYSEEAIMKDMIEKYKKNYKEFLSPYLKDKEYILENFLVNEFFKDMMPFGKYDSIWDSYMFLCILYSVAKLHLIGMSGYHKGLTDDLVIKFIQSFSKVTLHNSEYMKAIVSSMKDNDCNSLAHMSIFIKS